MKKYENYYNLFILCFITIILLIMLVFLSIQKEYSKYEVIPAYYILDNVVEVFLTDDELKYIEKNNYIFYCSKKQKIEIVSIERNAYKRGERRHQVLLRTKIKRNNKTNLIYISIYKGKENFIKLLTYFWKE